MQKNIQFSFCLILDFCESCAAVDPVDPKVYTEKIIFSTGCSSEICIADMQVKSVDLE